MHPSSKSQVGVEYMFILGFATIITLPLLIVYYNYSADSTEAIAASQALSIARKIVDSSESVYYLGKPSQTTLKFNFPENIIATNLSNKEVVIKIKTRKGLSDIIQVSSVNISGSLPTSSGLHIITVQAQDNYVQISSN